MTDPDSRELLDPEDDDPGFPDYSGEVDVDQPPEIPELPPEWVEAQRADVRVRAGEIVTFKSDAARGTAEFERLREAGDFDLAELSMLDEDRAAKVRGLCASSVYSLVRSITTYCLGVGREEFVDQLGKSLAVLGANITNGHNVDSAVPFTVHRRSGQPWNFGIVDVTLGESGAGKGVVQGILEQIALGALPIERAVDFSVPGLFGGHVARKDDSERVRGIVERAAKGIILIPEGDALARVVEAEGRLAILFAEFTATWRVERNFAKGTVVYFATPSIHVALQPEAWSPLTSSVAKLERRVFLSEIPTQTTDAEAEAVERLEEGLPLDHEGQMVIRAILKDRTKTFNPLRIQVSRVTKWVAEAIRNPPEGVRFREQDAQRVVAVAAGMWLMRLIGPVPSEVVVPSPGDDPDLLRIVLNDARLRARLQLPDEERHGNEVARSLRTDAGFIGTPEHPARHTTAEWIAQIARRSGLSPKTAEFAFYGGKDRRGIYHESLVDRGVLVEVAAPSWDLVNEQREDIEAKFRKFEIGLPERENLLRAINERVMRAGRPPKFYSFNFERSADWGDP